MKWIKQKNFNAEYNTTNKWTSDNGIYHIREWFKTGETKLNYDLDWVEPYYNKFSNILSWKDDIKICKQTAKKHYKAFQDVFMTEYEFEDTQINMYNKSKKGIK